MRIGAPDGSLTRFSGLAAVTELTDRLGVIDRLDAAIGPIKSRAGGHAGGELLVGLAAAQLAGQSFLVGLDRHRADAAGQQLTPVPGLVSTTAAGLARRLSGGQWQAVETGLGDVHAAALHALAGLDPARAAGFAGPTAAVTVDLDATDVEVYGRLKQGVAYNHQGQRVGRPHVAAWAETSVVLAADLLSGREDPRSHSVELLSRALAALPAAARAGQIRVRADAGYFAGALVRACQLVGVEFAVGAPRIAPLWRLLDGLAEHDWHDATAMAGAQVAVADYCPPWWPTDTRLLIRRVVLDPGTGAPSAQITDSLRARRRRTLHPDQRGLPLSQLRQLALAAPVYGYSFILTNLDVSTAEQAVAVEHWYRHRTQIENLFRDAKAGAALRHLPSGDARVNRAWMWGGLLAVTLTGWLHHLTATVDRADPDGRLHGHGVSGGQAMIATLHQRLIAVPARVVHHAGQAILRLPPGEDLLAEILARIRALPAPS